MWLVGPQLGMCVLSNSNFFAALHMSVNDCESATHIRLEVTNKFEQVDKFVNTESVNGDRLCTNVQSSVRRNN